jgi:hypothetical protein
MESYTLAWDLTVGAIVEVEDARSVFSSAWLDDFATSPGTDLRFAFNDRDAALMNILYEARYIHQNTSTTHFMDYFVLLADSLADFRTVWGYDPYYSVPMTEVAEGEACRWTELPRTSAPKSLRPLLIVFVTMLAISLLDLTFPLKFVFCWLWEKRKVKKKLACQVQPTDADSGDSVTCPSPKDSKPLHVGDTGIDTHQAVDISLDTSGAPVPPRSARKIILEKSRTRSKNS